RARDQELEVGGRVARGADAALVAADEEAERGAGPEIVVEAAADHEALALVVDGPGDVRVVPALDVEIDFLVVVEEREPAAAHDREEARDVFLGILPWLPGLLLRVGRKGEEGGLDDGRERVALAELIAGEWRDGAAGIGDALERRDGNTRPDVDSSHRLTAASLRRRRHERSDPQPAH